MTLVVLPRLETAQLLTGAQAVAHAMRQIEPDVVPVYPITPQTPIIEEFAQMVADGRCDSEIINVESEHSAMSAAVGASVAGARVMTATASQGLALMIEVLYIAASMRCPIVMPLGNRALSGPINIHCDHSDAMLARDAGAVQIFTENAQEAYDYTLMAVRLAEDERVLLPVLVNLDGFTLTHSAEAVELLPDEVARAFVGRYRPRYPLLDTTRPTTQGPFDMPDFYYEHKRQQDEAMRRVLEVFPEVQQAYAEATGRNYRGYYEAYRLDDAAFAVVVLGSTAGTAKVVVDRLRNEGQPVGLLKLWLFRPFPHAAVAEALRNKQAVAVMDRALSFGSWGPLYAELTAALYALPEAARPRLYNFTYGLGGRDVTPDQIAEALTRIQDPHTPPVMHYLGVRA
ncbi:pyruvate ferredoxin oxidoreductase [Rhodothermus profundi]|uniref:Pyruvate ferredoxin oxidoreductase, alpha subunit n=1 Tax=Rhodothermus profundi TaxID=633813 RepID=A0A1M6RKM3_9BACT|nr:pyruvate ferredoxin oxidoreductase [Rhodothermus profundi]SHK33005.1 pyruvate ferredoxin oxidoreductase, alpha subunit [Rhodothermus profundi]